MLTRQPGWGSSQLQPTARYCEYRAAPNCRCPGRYAPTSTPVTTPYGQYSPAARSSAVTPASRSGQYARTPNTTSW